LIREHKTRLLAKRPRVERIWTTKLEPGLHVNPDGGHIAASERELTHYNAAGEFLKTGPNGGFVPQIVGYGPLTARAEFVAFDAGNNGLIGPVDRLRPVAPKKADDDEILQTYLDHGGKNKTGLQGVSRREAEATWALFKSLTNNKALKDCTRDNGRKLIAHFQAEGLRSSTIQKKRISSSASAICIC